MYGTRLGGYGHDEVARVGMKWNGMSELPKGVMGKRVFAILEGWMGTESCSFLISRVSCLILSACIVICGLDSFIIHAFLAFLASRPLVFSMGCGWVSSNIVDIDALCFVLYALALVMALRALSGRR